MKLVDKTIWFFIVVSLVSCTKEMSTEYENIHDPKSKSYLPNFPTNLVIKSLSETSVVLEWTDMSAGEEGFIIERSKDNESNFMVIDTVDKDINEYTDEKIFENNSIYYYRVKAFRNDNNTFYTNVVKANYILTPPSNLTFSAIDKQSIQLNWEDNTTEEIGFRILGKEAKTDSFKILFDNPSNKTTYLVDDLDTTKSYEFKVISYTENNISEAKDTIIIIYSLLTDVQKEIGIDKYFVNLEFSNRNNYLLGWANDWTPLKIWDVETGNIILNSSYYCDDAKLHPDGKHLILSTYYEVFKDNELIIYDIENKTIKERRLGNTLGHIDIDREGKSVIINGAGNSAWGELYLLFYDIFPLAIVWEANDQFNGDYKKSLFNNSGDRIYCIRAYREEIIILNSTDGSRTYQGGGLDGDIDPRLSRIVDFTISSDDNFMFLYGGGYQYELQKWDLNNLTLLKQIVFEWDTDFDINDIDISIDNKVLAVATTKGVLFYRTSDFELIGQSFARSSMRSLSYSKDGNNLAVSALSENIKILQYNFQWDYYKGD